MSEEEPDRGRPAGGAAGGEKGGEDGAGKRRRRRRRLFHLSFWSALGLGGLVLALGLAGMAASGRVIRLPDWVADRIEARLDDALVQGSVGLGRVEFGVSPQGVPRLSLVDLALKDETGLELARIHRLQAGLSGRALLRGRFEPARLYLSGSEVTLRRRADGTLDLAFGSRSGATGDLAGVLDAIDTVFSDTPMAQIAAVEMDALTITLEDARSGRIWQVTDGRLALRQDIREVDITVAFDVFNQTEELAEVTLGFRSDKHSPAASIRASFRNAAATDIAAQSPLLAFLGVLDAPISGALRSEIDASGAVSALAGTLELGAGALSPTPDARPVRFETAKVYLDYDPDRERLNFPSIELRSELGEVAGQGHLYLRNYSRGWPGTLLGQFQIESATIRAGDIFEEPVHLEAGAADFRLDLDPFTLEIGQLVLVQAGNAFTVSGEVAAGPGGWALALDGEVEALSRRRALALWPPRLAPKARRWLAERVSDVTLRGVNASLRIRPGQARRIAVEAGFEGFSGRVVRAMAPLEEASGYMVIEDNRFLAVAESGFVRAWGEGAGAGGANGDTQEAQGAGEAGEAEGEAGKVFIAGTVFTIPDMRVKPAPATVDVQLAGPLKAVLTILSKEPYRIFRSTRFGPDVADGQLQARGRVALVMGPVLRPEEVEFAFEGAMEQVRSDVLVPGRTLRAERLRFEVDNARVEISGAARIGTAAGTGSWYARIGPEADGRSHLEAEIVLDQGLLEEFRIGLPRGSVSGSGRGQLSLDFARGAAPAYRLVSDLNRLELRIPELNWRKARNRTGRLLLRGHLGSPVSVERLELSAPGLEAEGLVRLAPGGGFEEAVFERVRLLGWLDAPVTIAARGPGRPVAIRVNGGSADMSRASFGEPAPGGGGADGDTGEAPVDIRLDRLKVSEGIVLTDFTAGLDRAGGLHGNFAARVNAGPRITGVVAPQAAGTAFRIRSSDAGGVLRAAGVFRSSRGGEMTLTLAPHPSEGVYDGKLEIERIRTSSAPALLELLGAISVVGLLEQVEEEGILFQTVEARFRLTPHEVIISKGSAVGSSLGISMDGTYRLGSGEMDLAGVLSPLYILNSIGQLFTRRGEGLIGFTYTLRGTPEEPKVSVNPLSIFTPAMFRELFRKPPPELPE